MIKLEDAVKIAEKFLEQKKLFIRNDCRDLGDLWIFGWGWKDDPTAISTADWLLGVRKSDGAILDCSSGIPDEESFERFMNAEKIDISTYIKLGVDYMNYSLEPPFKDSEIAAIV